MQFTIDARLNAYRTGGIPQYTTQLLQAMAAASPFDTFTVIEHRKQPQPVAVAANIRRHRLWTPPHNRFEQWSLPFELRQLRTDVYHAPDFVPPLKLRVPLVITIHDLGFVRHPEILDDAARRFYGQVVKAVRQAAGVIAVSQSTKRDLVELLKVPAANITVIPEAAAPQFRPINVTAGSQRMFGNHTLTADDFALFVGTIEPRKNLTTLLDALALCREQGRDPFPHLVIAGPRGWLDEPVFERIRQQGLERDVTFLGPVNQEELIWLYNGCRLFVNPELYCGFGLPVLEAMQCGAPVIAADTSALPEVVGDAGLLVRPQDVGHWASVLDRVWDDGTLRADLRIRGFEQARRFSWEQAAQQTLAVYRRAAETRRGWQK